MELPQHVTEVNPLLWRAIVGNGVHARLPLLNSVVNYFPQGHFEQSSTNSTEKRYSFFFVTAINFYCHCPLDELFARISLIPASVALLPNPPMRVVPEIPGDIIALPAKLRRMDVGRSDLYNVPEKIAQKILPPVGLGQLLTMKDVHGISWPFLYTKTAELQIPSFVQGWMEFIYSKGLRSSDTIVFMRRQSTGELFIGVRRILRYYNRAPRLMQARDAMQLTLEQNPIMVDYYPNGDKPVYVVDTGAVSNNMCNVDLVAGRRIKMRLDDDQWEEGTVVNWTLAKGFWRSLMVTWDKPSMNRMVKYAFVNPWNVEICELAPNNHSSMY